MPWSAAALQVEKEIGEASEISDGSDGRERRRRRRQRRRRDSLPAMRRSTGTPAIACELPAESDDAAQGAPAAALGRCRLLSARREAARRARDR